MTSPMRRPTTSATGSRSRSTSPTSTRRRAAGRSGRAVVRRRQGRARAVRRGGPGGDRRAARRSASRVFVDLKLHDIPTTVGRGGARARPARRART